MKFLLSSIFIAIAFLATAQNTSEKEVKQSIAQLFDAMQKGDTAAARNLFYPTARWQSLSKKQNGEIALENMLVVYFTHRKYFKMRVVDCITQAVVGEVVDENILSSSMAV